MQDATIGSGVCTDLENLEIRGPADEKIGGSQIKER
jgi:hypothetical protein